MLNHGSLQDESYKHHINVTDSLAGSLRNDWQFFFRGGVNMFAGFLLTQEGNSGLYLFPRYKAMLYTNDCCINSIWPASTHLRLFPPRNRICSKQIFLPFDILRFQSSSPSYLVNNYYNSNIVYPYTTISEKMSQQAEQHTQPRSVGYTLLNLLLND